MITSILQTKDLRGNAKKGLDDFFHVQGVYLFPQKVCSRWIILHQ
jgi:hypothetical protein